MQYQLIRSIHLNDVEAHVQFATAQGWKPHGPLVRTENGGYCQPVTRSVLMKTWVKWYSFVFRQTFVVRCQHDPLNESVMRVTQIHSDGSVISRAGEPPVHRAIA